jgi:phosphomannomutase
MEICSLNLDLASGTYFKSQKKRKQTAIIAKDTRLSGYHFRTCSCIWFELQQVCMFIL